MIDMSINQKMIFARKVVGTRFFAAIDGSCSFFGAGAVYGSAIAITVGNNTANTIERTVILMSLFIGGRLSLPDFYRVVPVVSESGDTGVAIAITPDPDAFTSALRSIVRIVMKPALMRPKNFPIDT